MEVRTGKIALNTRCFLNINCFTVIGYFSHDLIDSINKLLGVCVLNQPFPHKHFLFQPFIQHLYPLENKHSRALPEMITCIFIMWYQLRSKFVCERHNLVK